MRVAGILLGLLLVNWHLAAQLRIIVEQIPPNTPDAADIYITGSFNDWQPKDAKYQLTRDSTGTYHIELPFDTVDFDYKFTRGSWLTVESDINSLPRPNRHFKAGQGQQEVVVTIANWQELNRGIGINLYTFTLIVCLLFCLFFVIAIQFVVRQPNNAYTIALAFFPILLTVFAGRVFTTVDAFLWQPVLENLSHWVVLGTSLASLLILRWVGQRNYFRIPQWQYVVFALLFLLAGAINLIGLLPGKWLAMHAGAFQLPLLRNVLQLSLLAIVFRQFFRKRYLFKGYLGLLYVIGTVNGLLILWEVALLVQEWWRSSMFVASQSYVQITIVLWGVTLVMSTAYVYFPNRRARKHRRKNLPGEISGLKKKLEAIMYEQKAFRNPNLDLDLLADQMQVSRNTLSRVINDGYGMNFFDFVNQARVEEFVNFVLTDNYHQYTYQYISEKVGFNSKSSFHRAFRKFKGTTPREYFKSMGK